MRTMRMPAIKVKFEMKRTTGKDENVVSSYLSRGVNVPSFAIKKDRNRWRNFFHYSLQGFVPTWTKLLEERNIRFVASGEFVGFIDDIHTKPECAFSTLVFNLSIMIKINTNEKHNAETLVSPTSEPVLRVDPARCKEETQLTTLFAPA